MPIAAGVAADLIPTHTPGSPGWLAQRRTALGGSEVAAVLGLSPWESRFSLWHRKAGLLGPTPDQPIMEWGRRLESAVRDKWAEEHKATHTRPKCGTTWLRDGWMLASPDALPRLRRGKRHWEPLEIKTAAYADDWGPHGTDQIPVYYLTQVRWYLAVLGLPVAHLAVLIGGNDYREYTIERDPADEQLMITEGRKFLDSIEAGERPDIDATDVTYQAVRELHPDIDPERVEIDPALGGEYVDSHLAADAAAARHQQAKSRLLDAMGRAKHADLDGVRIAYRTARKKADGSPGVPFLQADKKTLKSLTQGEAA